LNFVDKEVIGIQVSSLL